MDLIEFYLLYYYILSKEFDGSYGQSFVETFLLSPLLTFDSMIKKFEEEMEKKIFRLQSK